MGKRIIPVVLVFWLMVIMVAVMVPGLSERGFWQDLERQAVCMDLDEGEQG